MGSHCTRSRRGRPSKPANKKRKTRTGESSSCEVSYPNGKHLWNRYQEGLAGRGAPRNQGPLRTATARVGALATETRKLARKQPREPRACAVRSEFSSHDAT